MPSQVIVKKRKKYKKRSRITEAQANYILDMREAKRIKAMFTED